MAKFRAGGGLTINQLEAMLSSRRSQLDSLERERARIMKQLASVDLRIKKLGGNVRGGAFSITAGGRARNAKSLVGTMVDVLTKAGGPLSVGDIVDAVQATGYQSNSANFRAILNQTLIKERKRFANTGRAMYALKK
jgi:hypothetical protein